MWILKPQPLSLDASQDLRVRTLVSSPLDGANGPLTQQRHLLSEANVTYLPMYRGEHHKYSHEEDCAQHIEHTITPLRTLRDQQLARQDIAEPAKPIVARPLRPLLPTHILNAIVYVVILHTSYNFIATRSFAERERELASTSSSVGTIGLRVTTSKGEQLRP